MRPIVAIACCLAVAVGTATADDAKPAARPDFKIVRTIDTGGRPTSTLAFSPDGRILAAAKGKRVHFWDTTTGKEARDPWPSEDFLDATETGIKFLDFVDAKTVAIRTDQENAVYIRSYPSGKAIRRLDAGQGRIDHFTTIPGLMAWAQWGEGPWCVRVFAAPDWKQRTEITMTGDFAASLAFSPDGSELATGTITGQIRVYRTADGELLRQLAADEKLISRSSIIYSPNGREIAVASQGIASQELPCVLELWDARLTALQATMNWDGDKKGGELSRRPTDCSCTPDGKTLVVLCTDRRVRLFETQTGELRHTIPLPGVIGLATHSPDGRLLAVRNNDGGKWEVQLIDWRAATEKSATLDTLGLEPVWADLASTDSAKGYRAVVALAADPVRAAKVIGERLKPVAAPNADTVKTLIADLGAEEYRVREAATKELAKLKGTVESQLRAAAKDEQPERRDRATRLLKAIDGRGNPERLRALRAVEVLEYADTPAGRAVLKTLAGGAPGAVLTLDAKAALARLEALDPKP